LRQQQQQQRQKQEQHLTLGDAAAILTAGKGQTESKSEAHFLTDCRLICTSFRQF